MTLPPPSPGTEPERLVVFVNAVKLEVPRSATALDAVRAWSADAARDVERGERAIADHRGLPTPPDTPVHGGAIFRLISARARGDGSDA